MKRLSMKELQYKSRNIGRAWNVIITISGAPGFAYTLEVGYQKSYYKTLRQLAGALDGFTIAMNYRDAKAKNELKD